MAVRNPALKLTWEDYERFPDDGRRHEILDGEHFVTAAPSRRHQGLSIELASRLHGHVKANRLGQVYSAPFEVRLSELDVVQPDLLFVSSERLSLLTEKSLQGAPDLVVEISSDGTRRVDEGVKRKRYERFGVREYWIVDARRAAVTVWRATPQGFQRVENLSAEAGDTLSGPLFPGLALSLADLFEEDRPR